VILVDTSGLLSAFDPRQAHHVAAARILVRPQGRILSPFVLAELDYLIGTNAGQSEELKLLRDVARGVYQLEPFSLTDIAAAVQIIERYADLKLGLADASLVVLAERYGCYDLLSLDQRHFRTVTGPNGTPFRLLPLDSV
jgi:predicted nucleic acid-binding protein